jgi:hypothetical protein
MGILWLYKFVTSSIWNHINISPHRPTPNKLSSYTTKCSEAPIEFRGTLTDAICRICYAYRKGCDRVILLFPISRKMKSPKTHVLTHTHTHLGLSLKNNCYDVLSFPHVELSTVLSTCSHAVTHDKSTEILIYLSGSC